MPDHVLVCVTVVLACLLAGAVRGWLGELGRRLWSEEDKLNVIETAVRERLEHSRVHAQVLADLQRAEEDVTRLERTVREYDQAVTDRNRQIATLSATTVTPLGGATEIERFVDRLARTDTLLGALNANDDCWAGAILNVDTLDLLDQFVHPIRLSARALLRVRPNFPEDTFHTYVQLIEIGCGFSLEQLLAQAYTAPECHHLVLNPDLIAAMAARVRDAASLSAVRDPLGSGPRPIEPKPRVRALEL